MAQETDIYRRTGLASIWTPIGAGPAALSLADQVATQLAEAIVNEEYAPGSRIHEVAVSERFHVSRGPVREALRILENAGLVKILPRRGAIVTKLSIAEVEDVFELRAVLVGLAARRLARACPAASLAQIEARVEELKLLAQQEDAEAATRYVRVSQDLSFLICVGTGSEQLTSIVYSLFHQTIRYTRLSLSTLERRRYSSKVWAELIVAIRSGNEIEAETTALLLVDKTREMAIEMLRNSAAPA